MRSKTPTSLAFTYCFVAVAWLQPGGADAVAASGEKSPQPDTSQILLKRALEGEDNYEHPHAETNASKPEGKLVESNHTISLDPSNNWLLHVPLSPWHDTKTGLIGGPSTVEPAATGSDKPIILSDKQRTAVAAALYAKAVMPTLSRYSPDEAGQAEQEELRRLLDPASPFMQNLPQLQTPTMLQFDEDLSDLPVPRRDMHPSLEKMEEALLDMGVSEEFVRSLLVVASEISRLFSRLQERYQETLGNLFYTQDFLATEHKTDEEERPTEKGTDVKKEDFSA